MSDLILAIDRGTTNVKATLFDMSLHEIAVSSHANPAVLSPHDLWAEADMELLWQSAATAVRALWADGYDPARVRAVVVAGQGNGLFLVDAAGQPVRPGILSLDGRAAPLVDTWKADGRYAAAVDTLKFPFGPGAPLPLLAWLAKHEPEVLGLARYALFSKDWIRLKLTGEAATDFTDASGAGLINHASQTYADDVFSDLGIADARHLMPPLLQSSAQAGKVTPQAAASTGLPAGVPVMAGAHDICACHNGFATLSPTALVTIFGTWLINLFVTPTTDGAPLAINHPEPGAFLSGAGDGNAGAVLDIMIGVFYQGESQGDTDVYALVDDEVASAPPSRMLFAPHLFGHALDPAAIGGLLGMERNVSRATMMRVVCEGIVLGNVAYLASFPHYADLDEIWLAGGGAKSRNIPQMMADAVGRPVHVAQTTEMVGRGAAISALIGLGELGGVVDAPRPAIAKTFTPDPTMRDYYQQKLAIMQDILLAREPLFKRMAGIELPASSSE
jgi:L-xylulokinase